MPEDDMRVKGPLVTLSAGVVVAAVLFGLSAAAKRNSSVDALDVAVASASQPPATSAPPASAEPTAAPSQPAKAPDGAADGTYAGEVDGGGGSLAIAVKEGAVVAYLCDGKRVEAWMQGTAADGKLALTGKKGGLTGTLTAASATGTATIAGKNFTFTLKAVIAPSGLYRSTANVRNAQVIGGWIVLPDGTQVGVLSVAGEPREAPQLNTGTRAATVDGITITAEPVTGVPVVGGF